MKASFRKLAAIPAVTRRAAWCAGAALVLTTWSVTGAQVHSKGVVHNLVILCQFPDHADGSTNVPPPEVYEARYNTIGGHPEYAPGGSVRDFFYTNSYGQLTITSTIVGWVKLPKESAYYLQKDARGRLTNWSEYYTNALALADPDVDFKQYDRDNSGDVDCVEFIHSGPALYQNCAGSLGNRAFTSAEGVKVNRYVNLSSAYSRMANIAHEMLHLIGIIDQYDPDFRSIGVGHHCLAGTGNKGWRVLPSHYAASPCAWCKVRLGWANAKVLTDYGVYTARSSAVYPDIFMIMKGYPPGEFLLIENRQPLCFYDGPKVPKGGLAVWHIDETKRFNNEEGYPGQRGWPTNARHYKIALLQADGEYHLERRRNEGDGWDYYFGGHTNKVLGQGPLEYPSTTPFPPTTDSYFKGVVRRTPNQISHVSPPGPEMTFTYEDPEHPLSQDGSR